MLPTNEAVMEFALSFPVDVRSLPVKGSHFTLKADEKECCKLAHNHNLLAVTKFLADFQLRPWKKRGVRLSGCIQATITQQCVITLEPIENQLEQPVDAIYLPDDSQLASSGGKEHTYELLLDAEGADTPEFFSGSRIDLGAVAEEFFELAIDPYPRKPEAHFDGKTEQTGDKEDSADASPFSVLDRLRRS